MTMTGQQKVEKSGQIMGKMLAEKFKLNPAVITDWHATTTDNSHVEITWEGRVTMDMVDFITMLAKAKDEAGR
jgi:hypothetical protein